MITKLKLLAIAVFYIVFRIGVYRDAVAHYQWMGYLTEGEPLHLLVFTADSFTMQQTMFAQTFFFIIYVFVTHKPITAPQFILRCQPNYFRELLLLGVKKVGSYSVFVVAVNTLIPIIYGSPIEVDVWYFADIVRFLLTVFVMFLIYVTLLFTIKRKIFSIVGVAVVNMIISFATLATWNEGLQVIVMNAYLLAGILLLGFIGLKCKKGDFL